MGSGLTVLLSRLNSSWQNPSNQAAAFATTHIRTSISFNHTLFDKDVPCFR